MICWSDTENGRASTPASPAGPRAASGNASSTFSPKTARTNTSCSTPRWFVPTSRPRPEKGGPKPGSGAIQRRIDQQIHMLADALGRPLRLILTGGQVHDIVTAPALLEGIKGGAVIADKAYDSNHLRQLIANAGMLAVIPSIPSRKVPIPHDVNLYKNRNRIERCFNKLKHFRCFATRFDRRAAHFLAFIQLACAMIWMR